MKKLLKVGIFFITLTLLPTLAQAFNPIGHMCVAQGVFGNSRPTIDLYYCSYFPDLSLFVTYPERWPDAYEDMHFNPAYADLRPWAIGPTQNTCAKGWLTHRFADFSPLLNPDSIPPDSTPYVTGKAQMLLAHVPPLHPDLNLDFAHNAIDTAIDLLLVNERPQLAWELLISNWFRSWQDRHLLVKALVWENRETDWWTVASSEVALRITTGQYARALVLPSPEERKLAIAEVAAQLALQWFGISIPPEDLVPILVAAMELCEPDYQGAIQQAIDRIINEITPP